MRNRKVTEEDVSGNGSIKIIRGSVTIRRVPGRKPQFTDQAEFDDLMDSMDALVLQGGKNEAYT